MLNKKSSFACVKDFNKFEAKSLTAKKKNVTSFIMLVEGSNEFCPISSKWIHNNFGARIEDTKSN